MVEKMDYEELRRIHRMEKNTSKLVRVEKDFFSQLSGFVEAERRNYLNSLKQGVFSEAKNFSNLKKLVEELCSLREKKLLNSALVSSRTSEESETNLTAEELKTFEKLLNVLQEHKAHYQQLFAEKKKQAKKSKAKHAERIKIKTIQEVPSFIGVDMKEYGPFKENEEIALPAKTAELLVERKLAEKI